MLSPRTLLALTAACAFPWLGCSTVTKELRPTTLEEAESLESVIRGRHAEVTFATAQGTEVRRGTVETLDIGGVLLQEDHEPTDRIPFVSTESIRFNDRGKGALRGLTAGAISGALTGFIAGAMLGGICMSSDTPCEDKSLSIGAAGALAGSLIMGGIGAGIGALIGHPTTLTF
jgi:hypothetical protein